jgi:hydrogenase-4 component B
VLSALFGALHAAAGTDLKRLLASSTTDNIGLALIGLGASGLFVDAGHPRLAGLAMVATLLHLVNHAAFKGSLFLSAGSVQVATGTRDLDHLGGLLRRLPVSGSIFLVGALAITGLPPLNGFVSEWLLFQALLHGSSAGTTAVRVVVPIAVATLALAGGLTAAAFVKAIGIGFLGRPRSPGAAEALEVPRTMQAGAALLAACCVVLGVVPAIVLPSMARAAATALPGADRHLVTGSVALAGLDSAISPARILLCGVVAVAVIVGLVRLRQRSGKRRHAEAWACGRELQTPRMQYTATSFAEPLHRIFDDVLHPETDLEVNHVAESRYFVRSISYHRRIDDAVERFGYRPVLAALGRWGRYARRLQNGSVHRYLAFALAALVLVLVAVR